MQALRCEEFNRMLSTAIDDQIGHDFSNHAGEFITVPGKAAGDGDLRMARMRGDHEMLVRRVGVQASDGSQARAVEGGKTRG